VSVHQDRNVSMASSPRRIDLHCHSNASNEADEAMLNAIQCPESYSTPPEVYEQAKRRGMDLVTITDHDSLDGVTTLLDRGDVLTGEELTCYFPEDHCKMHILIWGITPEIHAELQAVASDIYQIASIIERRRVAHSVAHPVYRQNDVLERWHLERLMLLFKGFETLNGAHSALHRESLEPLLNQLTQEKINELSAAHRLLPLWPEPWIKTRTAGSDDHGLFNIGRT
jgi:predicted metal-dependent phosphoesterase TrpH